MCPAPRSLTFRMTMAGSIVFLTIVTISDAFADEVQRQQIAQNAATSYERFWHQIAENEPSPTMSTRTLFACAMALSEAGLYPERLDRLLALGVQAQDGDPKSRGYGNLKWTWRDSRVTDYNAIEFCTQDALVVWNRHRDDLSEPARRMLRVFLELAAEGCLRHRVRTSYTNIALLNAGNLIVLGESLDRVEVADEGYRRLAAICLWTHEFGTFEYCSPTYYGVDLDGLAFIEAYALREEGVRQARAMLEFFWTDLGLNWFPPAERLAGPHSRTYDYLHGQGNVDHHIRLHEWCDSNSSHSNSLLRALQSDWTPPARLREMASTFPRTVRQSWGERLTESRTHMVYPDVTLGTSASNYHAMDMPMTVDLPGIRSDVRCYFIPDGREDPYGKKRYEVGSARHAKARHLRPFWTAAQRGVDAVGLVVYRDHDLADAVVTNVQSHFVLRKKVDGFWLGGKQITPLKRSPLTAGEALVFRLGTAAVGIRLLAARSQDGTPAPVALIDDDNPYGAIRLTVEHRSERVTTEAAAAFWVRIGSGLPDDEAFDAWRTRFERARPIVKIDTEGVRLEVPGVDGPVSVEVRSPPGRSVRIQLDPEPTRAALEWNGQPIGRKILEKLEPIVERKKAVGVSRPITIPASGRLMWEAESGSTFPGASVGDDPMASNGRFVWQSPENLFSPSTGNVSWELDIDRSNGYFLWGRVFAPTPENDSFYVSASNDSSELLARSAWHTGTHDGWIWRRVCLDLSREPTRLDLPPGRVRLRFHIRESGTKLDQLLLTTDPNDQP